MTWVLGQDQQPLYAAQADGDTPPADGWRRFGNAVLPVPGVRTFDNKSEATLAAVEAFKDEGKEMFAARMYVEAESLWSRGLAYEGEFSDDNLVIALFSNRAEARLRQSRWMYALDDANEVLRRDPLHQKALLRGCVALRELKKYDMARQLAQQCLQSDSRQAEAKQLLADLEALKEETVELSQDRYIAEPAWRQSPGDAAKADGPSDTMSKLGFKAFAGYGAGRNVETPLANLPYHFMSFPKEEVDSMDAYFQELRDVTRENARIEKENTAIYKNLRKAYVHSAREAVLVGKLEKTEDVLPSLQYLTSESSQQELKQRVPEQLRAPDTTQVSSDEFVEIDALFQGLEGEAVAADTTSKVLSGKSRQERRARFQAVMGTGR